MVKTIESYEEWESLTGGSQVVVVEYWVAGDDSCESISPYFAKLEGVFTHLKFFKVDVDEQPKIAQDADVKTVPTFIVYMDDNSELSIRGAQPDLLLSLVSEIP
ncbi:hypothetical protein L204_104591 [Cryptococcus depauperatus]